MPARINIPIGTRFGKLVVVERAQSQNQRSFWACVCDCGETINARAAALRAGDKTHCGCETHGNSITHGLSKTPEYKNWMSMKERCHNPKAPNYSNYGGRGIAVCDRWLHSFEDFLKDMGKRPTSHCSIDRYPDKDGNYEPENCRWATPKQQAMNRHNNRMLTLNGRTAHIAQWATELNISLGTLAKRMRIGWSDVKILTTPIRHW